MKYIDYTEDDFIKDEYFQKSVLKPDSMTSNFWVNWLESHPEKKEIIKNASHFIRLINNDEEALPEQDFVKMWQFIIQKRSVQNQNRIFKFNKSSRILFQRIAAVLVVGIAVFNGIRLSGIFNVSELKQVEIESRITLEMEDGTIKFLDEMASEVLTNKNGRTVISHKESLLSYQSTNNAEATLVYNQLTVPYGKKFEILLSDGTHIYLNSGSKLRYPVKFLKNKPRNVFLDGEAYFSVKKDKSRLFTVITDDLNTQVYGTEFNVSSYKNEKNTSTVLVEGSVGVYKSNNHNGDAPIMIQPGKRAMLEGDVIEIDKVNVNKFIAWKEDKLHFINDRFDVIVRELERHFNVKINNEFLELNEKEFTGTFTEETLNEILNIFKEHSGFKYTANGDVYNIISN